MRGKNYSPTPLFEKFEETFLHEVLPNLVVQCGQRIILRNKDGLYFSHSSKNGFECSAFFFFTSKLP